MKIIKQGLSEQERLKKRQNPEYLFVCDECECEFKAHMEEVKIETELLYNKFKMYIGVFANCPNCGKKVKSQLIHEKG